MFKIKKPEYVNKTFRIEKTLIDRLASAAGKYDVSMNSLVSQCCEYALDHMELADPAEEAISVSQDPLPEKSDVL